MGEDEKIAGELPRAELAAQLEALARKLRRGKFPWGEQVFQVAERVETKIKLKEKDGRISVKVRFQFPTLAAREETEAETQRRRETFQEVKKKLGRVFSKLLRAETLVAFPKEGEIQEYLDLSREFAQYADPAWLVEMQEYLDHSENLRLACQNSQFEMFRHELRDLQNRMNACHSSYK
jgi:XXXCH domain-containing protein